MSNIVYALTNQAMPGLVKIGMTDRDDVRRRMSDLYTTGVPLPFECVAARQIEDQEAQRVESALHTVFGPHRVNASREFFQIDPEQVLAILAVLPGRDVTPRGPGQDTDAKDEDQAVVNEYRKRQARTNEQEFTDSLNENGAVVYRRILDLGNHGGMRVNWTRTGFSLNVLTAGTQVPICYCYPPSSFNQQMYTAFVPIASKSNVPQEVVEALRGEALETGLFKPAGKGIELSCRTDLPMDESQVDALTGWLTNTVSRVREYEGTGGGETKHETEC
jgi:hypothetical protein